jgi:uncharacterized membrane protein
MKLTKIIACSFLFAGVLIRIILLSDNNLSVDDLYVITVIRQNNFIDAWNLKILPDPHLPLYYSLAFFWSRLFSDSIISLHTLSAVLSLLSIFVVYIEGEKILPNYAYLTYLAFVSIAPTSLIYFLEIRPYNIYLPASEVSTLYFISLANNKILNTKNRYIYYLLSSLVTCLSHYFGMALIFFQVFYLIIIQLMRKEKLLKIKNAVFIIPIIFSIAWFAFHVLKIKNNQIDTTWISPTGTKYILGYLGQIFGLPVVGIFSSNDPQSLSQIFRSAIGVVNVVSVIIPAVTLLILTICRHKDVVRKISSQDPSLLSAIYLSTIPFIFFFIIGKFIPIVNWKYMIGYIPSIWAVISLVIGSFELKVSSAKIFISSIALSAILFIPGLIFIPRYQLGEAINRAIAISKDMNIPLILPKLIEYEYLVPDKLSNRIQWHNIQDSGFQDRFLTVYGHCTPTEDITAPFACVNKDSPVLKNYQIENVVKFVKAGVYQFKLK